MLRGRKASANHRVTCSCSAVVFHGVALQKQPRIRRGLENQAQELVAEASVLVCRNDLRQQRLHRRVVAEQFQVGQMCANFFLVTRWKEYARQPFRVAIAKAVLFPSA